MKRANEGLLREVTWRLINLSGLLPTADYVTAWGMAFTLAGVCGHDLSSHWPSYEHGVNVTPRYVFKSFSFVFALVNRGKNP